MGVISGSIKIDNLRVPEPTQTTCWIGLRTDRQASDDHQTVGSRGVILGDACRRLSMLKATNAGFATNHTAHAATTAMLNLYPEHACRRPQAWSEDGEEIERYEASRLRHLLRCRLGWYGLRSVEVGSFRSLTDDALLVDLLEERGAVLCRVEVDRRSGVMKTSACQTLSCLLASERRRTNDSWGATPLFVQ